MTPLSLHEKRERLRISLAASRYIDALDRCDDTV